jgi:ABC-type transport system substrate-binding protein
MRVMRKLAWCLIAACSVLAACKARETPAPPAPATTTQAVPSGPVAGGRLVRRLETDANTLNYVLQTSEDERQVLQYLYDPMIDFDANLEPIPGTVAKWEIEDGGKAYVLHIDPRATFSDGKPVTAADVIFTLEKSSTKSRCSSGRGSKVSTARRRKASTRNRAHRLPAAEGDTAHHLQHRRAAEARL